MGAVEEYDLEFTVSFYFLDYEACEVKWIKGIEQMTRLFDLNFSGGTSNVVGLVTDGLYNYAFIINNAVPKWVNEGLDWPYYRIFKLPRPTSESEIMFLVDTSNGSETYIMEEDRLINFNWFNRGSHYTVDMLDMGDKY